MAVRPARRLAPPNGSQPVYGKPYRHAGRVVVEDGRIEAFAVTLVVILLFLTALFWARYRSLSLGVVVLAPVLVSLTWLLGTMSLLDIPFDSETAVITSLAVVVGTVVDSRLETVRLRN